MTEQIFKTRFISAVMAVWTIVVMAALYVYLFRGGPLPDPVLLGIPTGTWLAVYPPLPRSMRAEPVTEEPTNASQ